MNSAIEVIANVQSVLGPGSSSLSSLMLVSNYFVRSRKKEAVTSVLQRLAAGDEPVAPWARASSKSSIAFSDVQQHALREECADGLGRRAGGPLDQVERSRQTPRTAPRTSGSSHAA